jgi:DNA-binding transcriptional regulator YiaG
MIRTPTEFAEARASLGLTVSQCAAVCNVDQRTIRRWETGYGSSGARDPHPSACRIMEWLTDDTISARRLAAVLAHPSA